MAVDSVHGVEGEQEAERLRYHDRERGGDGE